MKKVMWLITKFFESIIKTTERMTYTDVNDILVEKDEALREKYAPIVPMLEKMQDLAEILRRKRENVARLILTLKKHV